MLEIIGFVLLLNALRRPIPPQTTDIRSNIAYSDCIKITTYSEEPSWIDLTGKTSRDMVCLTIYDDSDSRAMWKTVEMKTSDCAKPSLP
jgi:hypothetical protein